jgi:bacterioferritin
MKDAEALMDRILLREGHPNLRRVESFSAGAVPAEELALVVELETKAVTQLSDAIRQTEQAGDHGTSELLGGLLVGEEQQLAAQPHPIGTLGELNHLAQQVRS